MSARFIGIAAAAMFCWSSESMAGSVYTDSDGRAWLDLNDTKNFSWNEVETRCDASTGSCTGFLGSADLTGYVWASVDEVRDVFYEISGLPNGALDDYEEFPAWNTVYATRLLDTFPATFPANNNPVRSICGWSRTRAPVSTNYPDDAFVPCVADLLSADVIDIDLIALKAASSVTARDDSWGLWLYRTVPEPGTLALLGLGLAGLGVSRRREA